MRLIRDVSSGSKITTNSPYFHQLQHKFTLQDSLHAEELPQFPDIFRTRYSCIEQP
jgi:hypothetical protein